MSNLGVLYSTAYPRDSRHAEEVQQYIQRILAKKVLGLTITKEEEKALERTKAQAILYSKR